MYAPQDVFDGRPRVDHRGENTAYEGLPSAAVGLRHSNSWSVAESQIGGVLDAVHELLELGGQVSPVESVRRDINTKGAPNVHLKQLLL